MTARHDPSPAARELASSYFRERRWDVRGEWIADLAREIDALRRALVEAMLAECPGCRGDGALAYPLPGAVPEGYIGPQCMGCSWLRAFAVREGLLPPTEGGSK